MSLDKQKIKEIKKMLRHVLKKIFNKKVMTKALILISGLLLIASYTLPYILYR